MAGLLDRLRSHSPSTRPRDSSSLAPVTSNRSIRDKLHLGASDKGNSLSPSVSSGRASLAPARSPHAPLVRGGSSDASDLDNVEPLSMGFRLESGPLIMYGSPENSTGALLSGVLDLIVASEATLNSADLRIVQETHYFHKHHQVTHASHQEVLAQWDVLKNPQVFPQGEHGYPFSHLLPGELPCSIKTSIFEIEYYLEAHAIVEGLGRPVELRKILTIGRSVVSVTDRTAMRVFPPTELNLSFVLPTAIFPNSSFVSEMRIENLNTPPNFNGQKTRWNVRKVNWHFDETTKVKLPDGQTIDNTEVIYDGMLRKGWKLDFSTTGLAELVTRDFSQPAGKIIHKDLSDQVLGISISHVLHVEVLIAEETVQDYTDKTGTPSGRARVLRVKFIMNVVDPPGLGISWDDEVPPVYADVPLSPPAYEASKLVEIPHMAFSPLSPPAMSPTLRHVDPTVGDGAPHISLGEDFITRIKRHHQLKASGVQTAGPLDDLRPIRSSPLPAVKRKNDIY